MKFSIFPEFNQIKDKPGDSFYIRVGFDRNSELSESELSFSKDDVLYVDNTMFRGVSGKFSAINFEFFKF